MRPHILTLALAGIVAAGSTVAAQETPRARAQGTLPGAVFEQVDALARAAESEGLPGDPLFNKALEGAAKRVPADRLVPAVQAYAGRLRDARTAFGAQAPGAMLVAGADALQRGVGMELLRGLAAENEQSPMAVLVLADLTETGIPGDQALSLVHEAMRRRAGQQQMLDMPGEVRRLMRQGQSAQDAVNQVRRGMMGRGGGLTPPVAPGAEPMTMQRRRGGG